MTARRIDVLAALLGATATTLALVLAARRWFRGPWLKPIYLDGPMLEDWR